MQKLTNPFLFSVNLLENRFRQYQTQQACICNPCNLKHKPYGLTINLCGDDVSVAAIVYRKM